MRADRYLLLLRRDEEINDERMIAGMPVQVRYAVKWETVARLVKIFPAVVVAIPKMYQARWRCGCFQVDGASLAEVSWIVELVLMTPLVFPSLALLHHCRQVDPIHLSCPTMMIPRVSVRCCKLMVVVSHVMIHWFLILFLFWLVLPITADCHWMSLLLFLFAPVCLLV